MIFLLIYLCIFFISLTGVLGRGQEYFTQTTCSITVEKNQVELQRNNDTIKNLSFHILYTIKPCDLHTH